MDPKDQRIDNLRLLFESARLKATLRIQELDEAAEDAAMESVLKILKSSSVRTLESSSKIVLRDTWFEGVSLREKETSET